MARRDYHQQPPMLQPSHDADSLGSRSSLPCTVAQHVSGGPASARLLELAKVADSLAFLDFFHRESAIVHKDHAARARPLLHQGCPNQVFLYILRSVCEGHAPKAQHCEKNCLVYQGTAKRQPELQLVASEISNFACTAAREFGMMVLTDTSRCRRRTKR